MVLQNQPNGSHLHHRDEVGILLNILLATSLDLYSHSRHAFWSVMQLKNCEFEMLLDEISQYAKTCSEETVQVICESGREVHGTAREVFQSSVLPDYPTGPLSCVVHLNALRCSVAAFLRQIQRTINRTDSRKNFEISELLVSLSRKCENMTDLLEPKVTQVY